MDGPLSRRCDYHAGWIARRLRGAGVHLDSNSRSRRDAELFCFRQRRHLEWDAGVAAGSYAFVHYPSSLLWFAIEMYMLFVFGREVERFIGRSAYIGLYLILLVTPAALLTVWGLWQRSALAGSPALHFGIFVAFATIYPRAELFLRIMTKWVVLILAAIYTLQLLAYHAWSDLMVVWTSIAAAFLFIEMQGAGPELPWWDTLKARFAPRPKFHVVPKMHSSRSAETDDVYTSIDPILDKISKFGIGSLTASERRQLDRERERLLKDSK